MPTLNAKLIQQIKDNKIIVLDIDDIDLGGVSEDKFCQSLLEAWPSSSNISEIRLSKMQHKFAIGIIKTLMEASQLPGSNIKLFVLSKLSLPKIELVMGKLSSQVSQLKLSKLTDAAIRLVMWVLPKTNVTRLDVGFLLEHVMRIVISASQSSGSKITELNVFQIEERSLMSMINELAVKPSSIIELGLPLGSQKTLVSIKEILPENIKINLLGSIKAEPPKPEARLPKISEYKKRGADDLISQEPEALLANKRSKIEEREVKAVDTLVQFAQQKKAEEAPAQLVLPTVYQQVFIPGQPHNVTFFAPVTMWQQPTARSDVTYVQYPYPYTFPTFNG